MRLGDREFTSEEVALLCGVSRVTVGDWVERGSLEVRWTPGGHRRIPRASLAALMEKQGYSVPRIVASPRASVLVICGERHWRDSIAAHFDEPTEFDVERATPSIDAVLLVGERRPDVLVMGSRIPGFDSRQIIESVRRDETLSRGTLLVAVTPDDDGAMLRKLGADLVVRRDRLATTLRVGVIRALTDRQRRVGVLPRTSDADRSGPRPATPPDGLSNARLDPQRAAPVRAK